MCLSTPEAGTLLLPPEFVEICNKSGKIGINCYTRWVAKVNHWNNKTVACERSPEQSRTKVHEMNGDQSTGT